MPSKLLNRSIGKGIASFLGLMDQKNFPDRMHTDELLPVLPVGDGSFRVPEVHSIADLVNGNLVGLQGKLYQAWGPLVFGAVSVANPDRFANTFVNKEHWIRGIELDLTYDAAGSVTDDSQIVYIEGWIQHMSDVTQAVRVISVNWDIKGNYTFYPWVFPQVRFQEKGAVPAVQMGQWDGYVPPGFVFQVGIRRSQMVTLGTFPANTTINGHIWISEAAEGVTTNGR